MQQESISDKIFISHDSRWSSVPLGPLSLAFLTFTLATLTLAQGRPSDFERAKQLNKLQFSQNFKSLQVNSQNLLSEHESGKLTSNRLSKACKTINKNAKTLRALIALGSLATEPEEFDKNIADQAKFDQSIRKLHQLIYDFAHSPVHQNSKVFNTKDATKTQIELLTIIELSKALESQAKEYTPVLVLKSNSTN